jgi:uncharacterized iron-regulated membrane protein
MKSQTPRGAVVAIGVTATALAVLYPSFGVSLLLVLVAESIIATRRARHQPPDTELQPAAGDAPRGGQAS